VFEWRTGIVPQSIEKKTIEYKFEKTNATDKAFSMDDAEINFDIGDIVLDSVFKTKHFFLENQKF
jgi:hypothetical protein